MAINIKNLTKNIMIAIVLLLIAYDVLAIVYGGVEATISHITLNYSKEYPIIPFAVGVVCGHLFWSQKDKGEHHGGL